MIISYDKVIEALNHGLWKNHKCGDLYSMKNQDGSDGGIWRITYYPLFGTYRQEKWMSFNEPRALIERPFKNNGIDFREIPLRYLKKIKN